MLLLLLVVGRSIGCLVCCYMSTTCHKPSKQTISAVAFPHCILGVGVDIEWKRVGFHFDASQPTNNINNCPTTFYANAKTGTAKQSVAVGIALGRKEIC